MLRALRVSDLAIIDEIELLLEPGFNVITGETGAGKSILLQALDVALGGRPDADLVRSGADEAVVEAVFEDLSPGAHGVLDAAGIGVRGGDQLLVRRVIGRGGRTRAYLNGALGSLAILRDLAPHLLRVYGQDEHQALRRVESHRELLDAAAALDGDVEEMRSRWSCLASARQALEEQHRAQRIARERIDLLRLQQAELEQAALVAGEDVELTGERSRLAHAERLGALAGGAEAGVYSGEASWMRAWRPSARWSSRRSPSSRRPAPSSGATSGRWRPIRCASRPSTAASPSWHDCRRSTAGPSPT
jgi:DNA repair protein RecN (Recombination protein N)